MDTDTIAAIATASGAAGVGIIRISGPDAFLVADRLTRAKHPLSQQPGHTLRRATAFDPQLDEPIDDGLIATFHAPRSFTGENVIEFQGHGGTIVLQRVLAAVLASGARAARPGEFSERAFVNGKLELSQAEAIADLVSAGTVAAQRAARRQMNGELSFAIQSCTALLQEALAYIEATIDFPEEVGELNVPVITDLLQRSASRIQELLSSSTYGRRLQEGMTLVLAGRPNVGKSSLLNALSGTDRAIVTPIAGTTRDIVEEPLHISGIPVRAMDTAGLRETEDPVERIGVERARRAVADADVVLVVLDATADPTPEEIALLSTLETRPAVVVINKNDMRAPDALLPKLPGNIPTVSVSAVTGDGLNHLRKTIASLVTNGASEQDSLPLVTSARHEAALRKAEHALANAFTTLRVRGEAELVSVDVFAAVQALGEISGQTAREDIIAGIFSRFCLGK
jgi:tRNA modification GTPase